ncbi:hypothetical protein F2P45_29630 [Massilia sp. CCM 8733]|uniref:Mannosyl-glycoprotein endo-beta-N-acetylglucosamidase-like domain-containing protein n=1 Tax=Massilia mucilaginosa TaxID=2609282 RepID=A0ABX0P2R4_9BURK|nr:glucosaminidase domain-containing protein [Massilia mucilaginosa]NHZ93140.1 hypothetical protein [Massilia mucilaginosa]
MINSAINPVAPEPGATPCWSTIGRLAAGLHPGSRGAEVTQLQSLLGVAPDGICGAATEHALKISFVTAIHADARASQATTRVPAALTTAQAILESSYGRSVPTDINSGVYSYNLFGIKSRPQQRYVTIWTHEVVNGVSERKECHFAAYDSFQQSLDAHATFLTANPRYHTLFDSSDPLVWAERLHQLGYATDPDYGSKLIAVMHQWNLT